MRVELHNCMSKRKFYRGEVARSRFLVSPMVPYCQNLPDTPCSTALTLDLTVHKLNKGSMSGLASSSISSCCFGPCAVSVLYKEQFWGPGRRPAVVGGYKGAGWYHG